MCLTMIYALSLKRRLSLTLSWADVTIPLIFLNPLQWEIFANTPNLSHGSIPLFLIILYCYAWIIPSNIFRYTSLFFYFNFFIIYTGFGVFIGIITPIMLSIEYFYIGTTSSKKEYVLIFVSIFISFNLDSVFLHWI